VRKPLTALIVIGALGLLLAPTAAPRRVDAASPLRLNVGALGNIGSLDPRHGDSTIAREVWNLQYPTLTSLDPQSLDPVPGLAAAWSPAPRGRGWIYNLRPGVAWSDGQPLTADDVVYSLDHARDDNWPYATGMLSNLSVREVNTHSVEVTSTSARVHDSFPGLLLHVVPAHVFEQTPDVEANLTALGVSSGTWHVVAKSPDSVELDATSATGGPPVRQIVFHTYSSPGSLIDALAHEHADVISGLPDSDIGRLEALSHVTVDHAGDGTQYLLFDYFPDARVRQAVSLAIDRTELVVKAVNGVGTPSVVPTLALGASWALDDETEQSLTSSLDAQPTRAKQLLASVGSRARTLTMLSPHDPAGARVSALVRGSLAAVGIDTTAASIGSVAPDLSLQHLTISDDPREALTSLPCDICPAKLREYTAATDATTQLDTAHEMLQRATSGAAVVGLFQPDTLQAFRTDRLTGFLPTPQRSSLVVFGPTVSQYSALSAAPPPPGEGSSNTTYAIGAVIVLALCAAAYAAAAWIRRRFATSKENDEG